MTGIKNARIIVALILVTLIAINSYSVTSFAVDEVEDESTLSGITCIYVNPYGGEKNDIDTIEWFCDGEDYHLFLPADTDPDNCRVIIDASEDVYLNSIKLVEGTAATELVTEDVVTLYCGASSCRLHIHKSDDVPATFLTTDSCSLDYIHSNKSNKEAGAILIRRGGNVELDSELKQIKGRGNTTWTFPKKPYNIKLDKKTSILGMDKAKKWTLLANYTDPTIMRNPCSLEIAESFGLPYTSQYRHTDLYINGEYMGNYIICESIEVGENRVNVGDLEKDNEKANPDVNIESLPQKGNGEDGDVQSGNVNGARKWVEIPNDPVDITGGYLLELEFPYRWDGESSGFVTGYGQSVVIKSPEYASEAETNYIGDYFEEATEALYSPSGYNSNGKHFAEYFDMDSFARMYILQELSQEWDADTSSFFLIKERGEDNLVISPAWDYDLGFANYQKNITSPACYWYTNRRPLYRIAGLADSLLTAAYKQKDFREKVYQEWESIRLNEDLENVISDIREISDKLISSAAMNAIRWNIYGSSDEEVCRSCYVDDINELYDYLERRAGFLDKGFNSNSATLILDANGADVKVDQLFNKMPIAQKGDKVVIDTEAAKYVTAPDGKRIGSWNSVPDGSGNKYMPGDEIELTDSLVRLYAIWEDIPQTMPEQTETETSVTITKEPDLEWIGTIGNIPPVRNSNVRGRRQKITVSWKKLSKKKRTKYSRTEIQICTNKQFGRSDTIRKEVKKSSTKVSIKGLKKNKVYYVRIRNVKGKGASKTVSKWTKTLRAKVR